MDTSVLDLTSGRQHTTWDPAIPAWELCPAANTNKTAPKKKSASKGRLLMGGNAGKKTVAKGERQNGDDEKCQEVWASRLSPGRGGLRSMLRSCDIGLCT
jgi:hypothetical protein